ncbi:MAG: DNA-3-methyladenine glycosylase 2 family protein [Chloracidobacterium sp.]|nr:DNA-3-methyladenine glycosylase 2 family protein [Chloracidobacterium sp.]
MAKTLTSRTLAAACRNLAAEHSELAFVHNNYGTPPLWDREPGFPTLLHIILEQQVSLASAKACFDKLTARLGDVSPENVLTLNDAEMKQVGFSRQKTAYARHLSEALLEERLELDSLYLLPDAEVKTQLLALKGIGEWTSDIYLLMALLRRDVMPRGDIALHTAWHRLSGEPKPSSDEFIDIAKRWRPFRSVAARLLWHYYLSERAAQRRPKTLGAGEMLPSSRLPMRANISELSGICYRNDERCEV